MTNRQLAGACCAAKEQKQANTHVDRRDGFHRSEPIEPSESTLRTCRRLTGESLNGLSKNLIKNNGAVLSEIRVTDTGYKKAKAETVREFWN